MRMLILMRVFAQIIDISVYLITLVASYIYMLPYFLPFFKSDEMPSVILFISTILINFILQYPFLKVHQTIGKAFFRLKIHSTNPDRDLDVSIILQRELFAKLMSCYILCIPVLFGKRGGHEVGTETEVIKCIK